MVLAGKIDICVDLIEKKALWEPVFDFSLLKLLNYSHAEAFVTNH